MIRFAQESVMPVTGARRTYWSWGAVIAGAFLFCYAKVFADLVRIWLDNGVYSHGFLVPFISFYLILLRRKKLEGLQPFPSYRFGLPITAGGLAMLITAHAGGVLFFREVSLLVTIVGIVLLLLGTPFLRVLWFPIAYLSFMLTIWGTFIERLQMPLRMFSTMMAAKLIHFIGIPVYREQVYLTLPNITLEVANECSGVGNLISVLAIGIPLAYLTLKSWPRRIILVCGAVIIAILGNGLRVALIGTLSYYNIAGDLHGPYHVLQGMLVSFIGFFALFAGAWILAKGPAGPAPVSPPETSLPPSPVEHVGGGVKKQLLFLTAGILLMTGSYVNFYHPSPVPLKMDIKRFPYEIGEWKGTEDRPDDGVFKTLGVDRELARVYRMTGGKEVHLYIGYYESQEQGKKLVNWKSEAFHRGASTITIALNTHESVAVNKLIRAEGGGKRLILFWYDLNGRIVTDRYKAKIYAAWDALLKGRTNGAVIMVSSDFVGSEDHQQIPEEMEQFIQKVIPLTRGFLP